MWSSIICKGIRVTYYYYQALQEEIHTNRANACSQQQFLYAQNALDTAHNVGIFKHEAVQTHPRKNNIWKASERDLARFEKWTSQIRDYTKLTHQVQSPLVTPTQLIPLSTGHQEIIDPTVFHVTRCTHQPCNRPELQELNSQQRLAHDLVESSLLQYMNGTGHQQLLMMCMGEGGTGKSRVIQSITTTFEDHGVGHILTKTATSGVAATIINSETIHNWLGIGIGKRSDWRPSTTGSKWEARKARISNTQFLIIDECSMMPASLLALISDVVKDVQEKGGNPDYHHYFGGINVIMFGDFHQFPPIAHGPMALFSHPPSADTAKGAKTLASTRQGQAIYQAFQTVVLLKQQCRIRDPTWHQLLRNLRQVACTSSDREQLHKLVLTHPECEVPDFSLPPWNEAVLITPC